MSSRAGQSQCQVSFLSLRGQWRATSMREKRGHIKLPGAAQRSRPAYNNQVSGLYHQKRDQLMGLPIQYTTRETHSKAAISEGVGLNLNGHY